MKQCETFRIRRQLAPQMSLVGPTGRPPQEKATRHPPSVVHWAAAGVHYLCPSWRVVTVRMVAEGWRRRGDGSEDGDGEDGSPRVAAEGRWRLGWCCGVGVGVPFDTRHDFQSVYVAEGRTSQNGVQMQSIAQMYAGTQKCGEAWSFIHAALSGILTPGLWVLFRSEGGGGWNVHTWRSPACRSAIFLLGARSLYEVLCHRWLLAAQVA